MHTLLGPLLISAILSCSPQEEAINEGQVCLSAKDGQEAKIRYDSSLCFSSTCTEIDDASCSATLDGTSITVTSQVLWHRVGGAHGCSEDCLDPGALCTTPALAPGTYILKFGGFEESVEVPSESEVCIGESGGYE